MEASGSPFSRNSVHDDTFGAALAGAYRCAMAQILNMGRRVNRGSIPLVFVDLVEAEIMLRVRCSSLEGRFIR